MSTLGGEHPLDIESDGSFEAKSSMYANDGKQTDKSKTEVRRIWEHKETSAYVVNRLRTDPTHGLDSQEAQVRLEKYGLNVLSPPLQKPLWRKLLAHFTDFFSLMLQFAAMLCLIAFFTEPSELMHLYLGVFIYSVVILTSLFSFVQQFKSDQTLKQFRNFLPPQATVFRDGGKTCVVEASNLVVGDVVQVKLGDKIPADLRILKSNCFTVDNSSLTGESEPIELDTDMSTLNPLEARNLAFFGCSAVDGSCTGVVIATGDATVFGEIARLTSRAEEEQGRTTLQHDIHHFVINISVFAVAVGLFFFVVGVLRGTPFMHNLVYSIGIIVSNIPEGLLATVTVSLTASARRMARRSILVKQLDAVETLGSTTVICSDKTGTLTKNRMNVSHIAYGGKVESFHSSWKPSSSDSAGSTGDGEADCLTSLIYGASLCSTAVFDAMDLSCYPEKTIDARKISGDASEAGILRFTESIHSTTEFRQTHGLVATIPFNSKNKYMATVHKCPDSDLLLRVVVKGAPEIVLSRSVSLLSKDGMRDLIPQDRELIQSQMTYLASRGERVLAYAEQKLSPQQAALILERGDSNPNLEDIPTSDLCFVGLISLTDPPREGVPEAVQTCKNAGIKVIMVTGDHHETARSIAQQVGIITREIAAGENFRTAQSKADAVVVKGNEIYELDEESWTQILSHDEVVFARTSPHQKLEIVQNLQRMGEIVTVTGDGCNDAPALKQANTGVAMGISGSDVSREAANIVILDDHFASIVNGVEEGRLIFDNLKKSIAYTLTSNVPQLIPFLAFITLRLPLPLTTILILSIDLGTDIFPAIALAYEKPEIDIMNRPPRNIEKDHLMNNHLVSYSTLQLGLVQTLAGFFAYFVVMSDYGLGPRSLVGLNTGAHFATQRVSDQRWLLTSQTKPVAPAHDSIWFSRENPLFSKYFETAQPGFILQKEDQFSLLSPPGTSTQGQSQLNAGNQQFQNMIKINAVVNSQPPCLAFSCKLGSDGGVTVENDVQCFNISQNTGLVALNGAANNKPNGNVAQGSDKWEGCFGLWTPQREREVLRRAQTAFFAAIVVAQVFTLLACKTRILSLFTVGIQNSAVVLSLVLELCISLVIVYLPFLRTGFGVRPLKAIHWLPGLPFGVFIVAYDECRKWFIRRHLRNESGEVVAGNTTTDKLARLVHNYTLW